MIDDSCSDGGAQEIAIVDTTIVILEKVETCWIAGNTQKRSESHNKSKIRLLYRGDTVKTDSEL